MRILKILVLVTCLSFPLTVNATEETKTAVGVMSREEVQDEWLAQFDFSEVDNILKEIY